MSDTRKALESLVTDREWAIIAKQNDGVTAEQAKERILDALTGGDAFTATPGASQALPIPTLGAVTSSNGCETQDFDFSIAGFGFEGSLTICGGDDWTAKLYVEVKVAGIKVWSTTYTFGAHDTHVCFNPSVGKLASLKLCFDIDYNSDRICLGISGKACVIVAGCKDFDTTLFCVPLP